MSDTKRVFTQAVVHFKKSVWASVSSVASSAFFGAALYASEKNRWFLLLAGAPLLYGLVDLLWSRRNPLLSIAPWQIIHRPRFYTGSTEISRAELVSWRVTGKHLVLERPRKKAVKVNLGLLSGDDRRLAVMVLRERGYGNLES